MIDVWRVTIMISLNAVHDSASSEEDAESRAYRRIADAQQRDEIDELAAALGQVPDPAWHAPDSDLQISPSGRKETAVCGAACDA
jgi:hypothetical protein